MVFHKTFALDVNDLALNFGARFQIWRYAHLLVPIICAGGPLGGAGREPGGKKSKKYYWVRCLKGFGDIRHVAGAGEGGVSRLAEM